MAINTLQLVDLYNHDGKPASGLVPAHGQAANTNLSIDEKAAVLCADALEHIDYVFFRRFSDGRSSQISAYVVDNSDERLNEQALAELHLKVWLQGTRDSSCVPWPTRIDILTCAKGPYFWKTGNMPL